MSYSNVCIMCCRMSFPYKLRKGPICMTWANNNKFCYLPIFADLKHRIIILGPEMDSTPQY